MIFHLIIKRSECIRAQPVNFVNLNNYAVISKYFRIIEPSFIEEECSQKVIYIQDEWASKAIKNLKYSISERIKTISCQAYQPVFCLHEPGRIVFYPGMYLC